MFLRAFGGVPTREALADEWEEILEAHRTEGNEQLRTFYKQRNGDVAAAFTAAVESVRIGFLNVYAKDPDVVAALKDWRKDAKRHGFDVEVLRAYDLHVPAYFSAMEKGEKAYAALLKKYR